MLGWLQRRKDERKVLALIEMFLGVGGRARQGKRELFLAQKREAA